MRKTKTLFNAPAALCKERRGNMDYRQKIIEMVSQTENVDYLEFIYNMMISFRKKWGI